MNTKNGPAPFCRRIKGGISIAVRLTPKAKTSRITGQVDFGDRELLKASVTSAPENGRANAALERLVAGWLATPASSVSVTSGRKSRTKTVRISGDPGLLEAALLAQLAEIE